MPTAAAAQGPGLSPYVGGQANTPPTLAERFNPAGGQGFSQVQGPGLAPWLKQSTTPLGGFTLGAPMEGTSAGASGQPWYQANLDAQMAQAAAMRQQQAQQQAQAAQTAAAPQEDPELMAIYGFGTWDEINRQARADRGD